MTCLVCVHVLMGLSACVYLLLLGQLNFPSPIDDASSGAKFVKKQRTLKISAKVLQ